MILEMESTNHVLIRTLFATRERVAPGAVGKRFMF